MTYSGLTRAGTHLCDAHPPCSESPLARRRLRTRLALSWSTRVRAASGNASSVLPEDEIVSALVSRSRGLVQNSLALVLVLCDAPPPCPSLPSRAGVCELARPLSSNPGPLELARCLGMPLLCCLMTTLSAISSLAYPGITHTGATSVLSSLDVSPATSPLRRPPDSRAATLLLGYSLALSYSLRPPTASVSAAESTSTRLWDLPS